MNWLRLFTREKNNDEHDKKLVLAEQRVEELEERAGTAKQLIKERMGRNHWGETVKLITHGYR